MRYDKFLNEAEATMQKLAFMAVKEILAAGLRKANISVLKKDKTLKIKMPDRKADPMHTFQKGMEFVVDVIGENKILINNKQKDVNEFIKELNNERN
jgi:hypothetical protein